MLPYFILTPNNYVNSTSCKKLKRLQFNINLINRIKNEVNPNKKFFSIDTESFIQEILTEFGWSVFNNNGTVIKEQHFIIDETYDLRNNDYIPENKKKYLFGNSERKPFHEIIKILQNEIDNVDFIIGQGIHNDIKYLHDSGIDFTNFTFIDGDSFDPNGKAIIEISDLFSAYSLSSPKSLEYGLNYFKIKYKNLHNAGNDAHYTMIYFLNIINNYDFDSPRYQRLLELNVPSHVSPCK
ncbi:hypothetical protein BCR36DRAFT_291405 [Piromyces finnis]|uniref:Gfd2/YDR514C-like C-terminal domain-containing protein n=1 Tax=Piromyces finnis TaxID=1754191 RepID=A0A1Y1V842_9FUNG|nr:hypothetical protein BCR36DRAFT_291405 [Piromyces finnis]|eukprot:ORX49628.1 hypothetical protein BCR36DRAFT_291405 [Piromyces finnis]